MGGRHERRRPSRPHLARGARAGRVADARSPTESAGPCPRRNLLGAHATPGDARLAPDDAIALLDETFDAPLLLEGASQVTAVQDLARAGLAGGATYDGLVALAARAHDAVLITRDARASSTNLALGVQIEVLPPSR